MDADNARKQIDIRPSYEMDGPYINAPDWPWSAAGWVLAAMIVVLFVVAELNR
jgi:hypothetical protein